VKERKKEGRRRREGGGGGRGEGEEEKRERRAEIEKRGREIRERADFQIRSLYDASIISGKLRIYKNYLYILIYIFIIK